MASREKSPRDEYSVAVDVSGADPCPCEAITVKTEVNIRENEPPTREPLQGSRLEVGQGEGGREGGSKWDRGRV